jgi:hypothetical protein
VAPGAEGSSPSVHPTSTHSLQPMGIKFFQEGLTVFLCAHSSVGQSAGLRIRRSQVRALLGAPREAKERRGGIGVVGLGRFSQ